MALRGRDGGSTRKRTLPPPRVRVEPPTIEEAAFAAIGLADAVDQQVEIAAGLMGVEPAAVRDAVVRAAAARSPVARAKPVGLVSVRDRIVAVERTNVRRVVLPSLPALGSARPNR